MIDYPKISDPKHYLNIAKAELVKYYEDFQSALNFLQPFLKNKELASLLKDKLQFNNEPFKEKPFIQMACELTVTSSLAKLFPADFVYEKRVTPPKNVDCFFKMTNFGFNVEVKCPSFDAQEEIDDKPGLKIVTVGRLPNHHQELADLTAILKEGMKNVGRENEEIHVQKSMDNNLKDFLVSAGAKFPNTHATSDLNLLVVCCSDASNIQEFFNSLFGHNGLFNGDSFHDRSSFSNVDVILFTNLYHKHHKFYQKQHLKNNWDLNEAFNLFQVNPQIPSSKHESSVALVSAIKNYSLDLLAYDKPVQQLGTVGNCVRVIDFVKEELESKGNFLF